MKFQCKAKAVKADMAKNEITISFTMERTPENMEEAEQLAQYADKDHGDVNLVITPAQLPMFKRQP